jgi:putative flavoprotein involved in K+ transport
MDAMKIERHETVIIGGGQAGLATGHHLAKAGRPFVILEANGRIGDSWRKRWDSLRLFTPAEMNGLPGFPHPARRGTFPTKDEMADYLVAYAARFALPVRTGVRVTRLSRRGESFLTETADTLYESEHVVVATGPDRAPRVPALAADLDGGILQLHSSEYRSAAMLRPGTVLVVGAANSGAEVALDVAPHRHTLLAGRYQRSPFGPSRSPIVITLLMPIVVHLMTIDTPIGRRVKAARMRSRRGVPVERVSRQALAAAGVELVPRVERVHDGRPVLADGRELDVSNIIWCTGFAPGLEWIDLPIHDAHGEARQTRGVVPDVPGLYFVGRHFQYAWLSGVVAGVGRDAGYVAQQIERRVAVRDREVMIRAARA